MACAVVQSQPRACCVFVLFFVSRHLSSLSCGRGLVLVGDKGYVSAEEMKGDRDPHIAYHGSLSCMVSLPTAVAAATLSYVLLLPAAFSI